MDFNLDKLPVLPEGYLWVITGPESLDSEARLGYLNIYQKTEHQFLFWKYTKDTCVEKDIIYDFYFKYYGDNGLLHVAQDIMRRFEARNLIYKTHRMMEN